MGLKPALFAIALTLVMVTHVPQGSLAASPKELIKTVLSWLTSDNPNLQKKALGIIISKARVAVMKKWSTEKEDIQELLNLTAPLMLHDGTLEVMKEMVPLLRQYGRPSLIKMLHRKEFRNATFTLIDEFKAALANRTGIDHTNPKESLRVIFERVNWKTVLKQFKPLLNSSNLAHNVLLVEILGDFIPKPVVKTLLSAIGKFLSKHDEDTEDKFLSQVLRLVMEDLSNGNYTGLSDDNVVGNVKLIIGQIKWKRILRAMMNRLEMRLSNYTGTPRNETTQCQKDLLYTLESTFSLKKWALTMLDAHGKIGAGLMRGRLHAMGSYEECHGIRALDYANSSDTEGTERFHGHYCRLMWSVDKEMMERLSGKKAPKRKSPMPLTFAWGVCMPDTCNSEDVRALLPEAAMKKLGFPVHDVYCGEKPELNKDGAALTAIVIIAAIVTFIFVGTLFDLAIKCRDDGDCSRADDDGGDKFRVYSVPRQSGDDHELKVLHHGEEKNNSYSFENNHARDSAAPVVEDEYAVLRADDRKSDEDEPRSNACVVILRSGSILSNLKCLTSRRTTTGTIHCLHGIRVFSMSWIILISTYYFAIFSEIGIPLTENLLDAKKLMQRFVVQLITSGPLAIDTFFVLGATLASFWMLKRLEHDRKIRVPRLLQYITHRIIRILPMYMIIMMAFSTLYQYNGHGPLWFKEQPAAENCRKYWWANLLFINNIVHKHDICMPWSWYLANDMQYYIIGLGFIILIYKYPKIGIGMTLGLGSIGIISTAVLENMGAGGLLVPPTNPDMNFKEDIWIAPWCRVSPYAIGLILGYVLHKTKKVQLGRLFYRIGWVVALTVGLAIVFLPYTEMGKGRSKWSQSTRTAFESLHHTLWALCVSFVIFACHTGHGGYVNRFLSWTMWVPLSRVTFAAYLVHPVMMVIYVYTRMQLVYLADLALLYMFVGHWVFTYVLAFLLTACVEMPFRLVEKVMLRTRSPCCEGRQ